MDCGTGALVQIDNPGQIVEIVLAGGSGYGNPAERDPAALARDVQNGLVSADSAGRDYARHLAEATPTA
jgi:5-oxoprolinase (ATP-hydrolysing)/N-methylhydantoinase A